MRFKSGYTLPKEGDMTSMIDMVFQLVCFFMVALNFSEAEVNERVHLPSSELARPPEGPMPLRITLHLTPAETVIFGGEETRIPELRRLLVLEKQVLDATNKDGHRDTTIIIRADAAARTGKVQELIKQCQDVGFEKFVLRAKQQETKAPPLGS
jgi:biopolymer transport protein ExbD